MVRSLLSLSRHRRPVLARFHRLMETHEAIDIREQIHHIFLFSVTVILVPNVLYFIYLFFFVIISLCFAQNVRKTLYYDLLIFSLRIPPLWLSRDRVSF